VERRFSGGDELTLNAWASLRRLQLEDNFTGLLVESTGDRKRQSQGGGTIGAHALLHHKLSPAWMPALQAGAGWQMDRGKQKEQQVTDVGETWRVNRNITAAVHQLFLFVGLRLRPLGRLELIPALRGDLFAYSVDDDLAGGAEEHHEESIYAISPRLAMSYPVGDALSLFADYGRGLRSPEPRSIAAPPPGSIEDQELSQYRGGRPAMVAADVLEVGVRMAPLAGIEAQAACFATWIEREVVFDHVSNTNVEMDGTRRLGIEASVQVTPTAWLRLDADLTWVDARFLRSGNHIPGSSPLLAHVIVKVGGKDGFHGHAELLTSAARSLAHGAKAAGFALLDLSAGWRLDRIDLSAVLDNAFNSKVMAGAYHYASWFDPAEPRSGIPVIHYSAGRPLTARLVLTAFL
jgi:outer membrane receptor protein involved in Fe transport